MSSCVICQCEFSEHAGCLCGGAVTREHLAQTADALERERILHLAQRFAGKSRPYVRPPRVRVIFDQIPEPRA